MSAGYNDWPRWIGLSSKVPEVRAAATKPGVTLSEIDRLRDIVWNQYEYNKRQGASDWDPMTGTYPADPTGVCRHKATWLQQRVGGTVLYGRRTDRTNPGMHAVLWVRRGNFGFIVDKDGVWPEQSAPWVCDATHRAYKHD